VTVARLVVANGGHGRRRGALRDEPAAADHRTRAHPGLHAGRLGERRLPQGPAAKEPATRWRHRAADVPVSRTCRHSTLRCSAARRPRRQRRAQAGATPGTPPARSGPPPPPSPR